MDTNIDYFVFISINSGVEWICILMVSERIQHFLQQITELDYHKIIKNPMAQLRRNLKNKYFSATECIQDFKTMFKNCFVYNQNGDDIIFLALELQKLFRLKVKNIPPGGKDDPESNSDPAEPKKGISRIFRRFANKSSMQGPSYIVGAKWWLPRVLWIFLLLAALALMSLHLYYLCQTYLAWPTKNKITLGFSSLPFPAVTICNVNRVRASKLKDLSEDFQYLVALVDPENMGKVISKVLKERRQRHNTTFDENDDAQFDDIDFGIGGNNFTNARKKVDNEFYVENLEGYSDSWESEAKDAKFYMIEEEFRELYAAEDRPTRTEAGHKLNHMLVGCSFAGKTCYARNFTQSLSTRYGNCYTLQYDKFISRKSGPVGGLELLIFLDLEEYVRGITPEDGLQVTIHPRNTMPFPYEEGVAVAGGTHTMLSLKLVHIERKGHPYSVCFRTTDYLKDYGVEYTRQTCQEFCEQKLIHSTCNCRDETHDDLNSLILKDNWIKPCRTTTEMHCMVDAQWRYRTGTVQCKCEDPCQEDKYQKSMSFRPWPNQDYAEGVLLKKVCHRETSIKCQKLETRSPEELTREFVKLSIFYEDLNYENITEHPDYEDVQFVSDIGGTVGLWIGLSVLSVMEVLQPVVELFRYLCCCRWRQ